MITPCRPVLCHGCLASQPVNQASSPEIQHCRRWNSISLSTWWWSNYERLNCALKSECWVCGQGVLFTASSFRVSLYKVIVVCLTPWQIMKVLLLNDRVSVTYVKIVILQWFKSTKQIVFTNFSLVIHFKRDIVKFTICKYSLVFCHYSVSL